MPTNPLLLAASLTFTDWTANSYKFHDSALLGRHIVVRFGRVGSVGQEQTQTFGSAEQAAAKYWGLLRGKVGKGYHVDHAAVLDAPDPRLAAASGLSLAAGANLLAVWSTAAKGRRARGIGMPDLAERSPRTPKQGATVILALSDPDCPEDILLSSALAGPSERFLYPMVLSHPNCPDEARVARALADMAAPAF